MHPTKIFRQVSREANLAFARDRGFGVLSVSVDNDGGPLMSHIPFLLTEDCSAVHAHLIRKNPILQSLEKGERPAVIAVSGPDSYISPDWYEADPGLVPTWNYVAVHLRGRLRLRSQESLRDHLSALAMQFEQRLLPKPPWLISKVPERQLEAMMRTIAPVELELETVDGTWKLNQNRPAEARLNAARHVDGGDLGMETATLAGLMRDPPEAE
ncbi:MAG: FMN-binding negative transcriptional regulator [Gammaproteobacteria bacterium]|nr:FMN-binding negative transcriptional regulator [Gammaproteobacteria bacterium]MYJ52970.1 FMN-binding negative transcriptional regulator [Gammaproteobacteria bacterium]